MDRVPNPREYLGKWIKPAPIADQTHLVLRYDGLLLVAYCGCLIRVQDACKPNGGARHFVNCETLRRKQVERREHAATHQ